MQTSLLDRFCTAKMHVMAYVGERPNVDVAGRIVAVNDNFIALVQVEDRLYQVDLLAETTRVDA